MKGLLLRPNAASALLVLAHGAGAGMRHPFMEALADALARERVATYRFEFPYMAAGRKRPDPAKVLEATALDAVRAAREAAPDLPLFAGGKSMGGRMLSHVVARGEVDVRGLVFVGFPLHRANEPSVDRARHLVDVKVPMLFLQGTRDALAEMRRMRRLVRKLGATLHVVRGADHAFAVPKRKPPEVIAELAAAIARFAR